MKLNRGIIESNNIEGLVSCVASLYKLNNEVYRESIFIENQKVLGASTENTFNIWGRVCNCYICCRLGVVGAAENPFNISN